ncbi:hypothetical protein GGI20_004622 [Coemansia sp. BCRC 34301]|nr:hypothetical protein GGI20_004622 [Coemansia sp. BCRC 34301]
MAELGGLLDQSDSALQLRLTEYASRQSSHSGSTGSGSGNGNLLAGGSHIRALRSWSSSDRHGPRLEDSQGKSGRGPRRFSVAGPAGSGGSTVGSRQSQKHLSLHTWAEEDEIPDTSGGQFAHSIVNMSAIASRNVLAGQQQQQQQQQQHVGKHGHAANHYRNSSHGGIFQVPSRYLAHTNNSSSSSSSVSSGTGGGMFGKRMVPEATFGFVDVVSSSSSSNGPPSTQHTASNSVGGSHRRLRTPYSISIPSMIGSPLSFTQSFLASRSSMYGRQPPSSQIRAAHIDWDSLSMMEEAAAAWGHGGNRGDLPVWQQGMGLPIDFACGGGGGVPPKGLPNFQRAHAPAGTMGEGMPQHLQHMYQQQQLHYYHLQQQQMLQQQQRQQQAVRNSFVSDSMHAHMAAAAAVTSGGGGLPGSLGDVCASMAQVAVAREWERQMAWDYACHHHPLLASFSVASPLKLSAAWRWALLGVLAIATMCVLIGTPAALAVLLGKQGSSRFVAL